MKTTRKTHIKKTGKTYYYELRDDKWTRITEQHYERHQYVVRNGRINKQRLGRYLKNADLSWESEILSQIRRAEKLGQSRTLEQVIAMSQHNQVAITLTNLGMTPKQIADELGITEEELLNVNNWNPKENGKPSSIFTNPVDGKDYELIVRYEGESAFRVVNE